MPILSARANIAENQCAQEAPKKMDHRRPESENKGEMAGFDEPVLVQLIMGSDEKETRLIPGIQLPWCNPLKVSPSCGRKLHETNW